MFGDEGSEVEVFSSDQGNRDGCGGRLREEKDNVAVRWGPVLWVRRNVRHQIVRHWNLDFLRGCRKWDIWTTRGQVSE